jgi:hypothetical protein
LIDWLIDANFSRGSLKEESTAVWLYNIHMAFKQQIN